MKWLNCEYIRQHSRIDFSDDDSLLEMCGESAEETVLNILGRDYDDLVQTFGKEGRPVPAPIIHASLMLVEIGYAHRAPITQQNLYMVPYGNLDFLIKPYMRLTNRKEGSI